MSKPEAGDRAPDFTLPTDGGGNVSLADYAGKVLVLYFYPRDDTPGCTKQAIGFTEKAEEFAAAGAAILGISNDPVAKHDKFKAKHSLGIDLAADPESETIAAYGAWVEKNMYGKKSMGTERSTFLIDGDGIIRQVWRKVRVPGHIESVLTAVRDLD